MFHIDRHNTVDTNNRLTETKELAAKTAMGMMTQTPS
jgi:hypothetical protein